MEMISLKCKECGGVVEVDASKNVLSCPYCGSKEMIPESDQVKIARIKASERIEREHERQKSKRIRDNMIYYLIFGFIVAFIIFAIIGAVAGW